MRTLYRTLCCRDTEEVFEGTMHVLFSPMLRLLPGTVEAYCTKYTLRSLGNCASYSLLWYNATDIRYLISALTMWSLSSRGTQRGPCDELSGVDRRATAIDLLASRLRLS
ncbi:hypothetical protein KC361_g39 [Hortaea werneckii]|nr:hypothetical protein KC361_g39 [Hortaea werneckii]